MLEQASTEFIELIARKQGRLIKGGEPDEVGVAKQILNDFNRGKIPWFVPPPKDEEDEEDKKKKSGEDKKLNIRERENKENNNKKKMSMMKRRVLLVVVIKGLK